jgi:phage FluMu gp28-like protein
VRSKLFLQNLPKDKVTAIAEELAFRYPTWFFELYTEFDGKPLVLEDFQVRYLLDDSTFKITNKTRQAGGSLMVAYKKAFRAFRNSGYRCDMVSINMKEAIDKIRYIRKMHDTLPKRYKIPLTVNNATSIGFHEGAKQSIILSIAATAAVRGGKKEMVFDEFGHIKGAEELLYAAAPAIINGDLTLDVISTPNGDNDPFAKIWFNRPDERGVRAFDMFSRHQFIWCDVRRFTTDYEAVQNTWYNEYKQNMMYMPQLIEEFATDRLKFFYNSYPWSQFQQEFCGVFLNEAAAFFPQALIQKCLRPPYAKGDDIEEKEYLDAWTHRPENNTNQVFMGVDFGESSEDKDKTSIQILERLPGGLMLHRYSKVLTKDQYPDFPSQAEFIVEIYKKFRPQKVSTDDTGLGRGINPLLKRLCPDIPLEEVNFNYVSKEKMVMDLKTAMEKGNLWLQQEDVALQGQIRNIERKITESGRATYHGKPHDDMFWALALAARQGGYTDFAMYQLGTGKIRV